MLSRPRAIRARTVAPRMSRRHFLQLGFLAVLGLSGYTLASPHFFEVSRYRTELIGLEKPIKVVQLTDLHYGPYFKRGSLRNWISSTLKEKPDLILITGDLVDKNSSEEYIDEFLKELPELKAPLGVFAVMGNHDHAFFWGNYRKSEAKVIKIFREKLAKSGVQLLVNEGLQLRKDLFLAGVDDFNLGKPDVTAAFEGKTKGSASILMSHSPDLLPQLPVDIGLTLCGHTHGGQVVLPVIGPLVTNSIYGKRFLKGFVKSSAGASGFVSRGLGASGLPVRFACPPEIVVFDFEPLVNVV